MEVLFFLKERTKFIRHYYDVSSSPFRETIRKIEIQEPPYEPPYSEDAEPPFQLEWDRARIALEISGRTCISMLSASLQLYFSTWESELGAVWKSGERKKAIKRGTKNYLKNLDEILKLSWDDCPVDFEILDQVILARNRDQHPESITTLDVKHTPSDRQKYPQPFFISDIEKKIYFDSDMASISWMNPRIHISRETLFAAIDQVDSLGQWLEERMFDAKYPSRR